LLLTWTVSEFFARLANVAGSSAALVATDGTLLLRYPSPPPGAVGADRTLRSAVDLARSGTYEAQASIDDVARLYAFSQLDTLPVVARFGVAKQAVVEAWFYNLIFWAPSSPPWV
jgi:hypothetical protein